MITMNLNYNRRLQPNKYLASINSSYHALRCDIEFIF